MFEDLEQHNGNLKQESVCQGPVFKVHRIMKLQGSKKKHGLSIRASFDLNLRGKKAEDDIENENLAIQGIRTYKDRNDA